MLQRSCRLLRHIRRRFVEVATALGVAEDDIRNAGVSELRRADLTSECTRVFEIAVLRRDLDLGVGEAVCNGDKVERGRCNYDLCSRYEVYKSAPVRQKKNQWPRSLKISSTK